MSSKLDISLIPGIGLKSQIKPDTADLVQLQARFVQFSPNDSDLKLLGISSAIAKGDDRCANNLVDVLIGLKNSIGSSTSDAYVPYTGATKAVDLGSNSISAQYFILNNLAEINDTTDSACWDVYLPISGYNSSARGGDDPMSAGANSIKIGSIVNSINLSVVNPNKSDEITTHPISGHLQELIYNPKVKQVDAVGENTNLPILLAQSPNGGIGSVKFRGNDNFAYNPSSGILTVDSIRVLSGVGAAGAKACDIGSSDIPFDKIYAGSVYLDTPTSSETNKAATVEYVNKYVNNTVTKVLVFRGVVTSSDGLPVATNASVGDVYHLNVQVTVNDVTYEIGDELVCIESGGTKKWELLGRNNPNVEVAPIDANTITLEWLESA